MRGRHLHALLVIEIRTKELSIKLQLVQLLSYFYSIQGPHHHWGEPDRALWPHIDELNVRNPYITIMFIWYVRHLRTIFKVCCSDLLHFVNFLLKIVLTQKYM